jgi:hypothetical protein
MEHSNTIKKNSLIDLFVGSNTVVLTPLEVVLLIFRILGRENTDLDDDTSAERLSVAVRENVCGGGMETAAAGTDAEGTAAAAMGARGSIDEA